MESWWKLELKALEQQQDARVVHGWATTPETDRMDDIVLPEGAKFSLPMPLLWQHNPRQPIGLVTQASTHEQGISMTAQVERGVDYIDQAWELIKRQLVRGLSIGFRSLQEEPIKHSFGSKFLEWEWLELSVVTIPANAGAGITSIKALDRQQMRAALGNAPPPVVRLGTPKPGAAGAKKPYVIRKVHT